MPIAWGDAEVRDRLLAAIIGSFDNKINCREVARLFGEGATYDAIENFLRKPKKKAMELKAQAGDGPAPSTPRKPRTPKVNGMDSVKSGRVTKSTPKKNGSKSANGSPVKREVITPDSDEIHDTQGVMESTLDGEYDEDYGI